MLDDLLKPHRSERRWTMDALVNLAAEIIPRVAGPQERHKVTEVPDARTVRYYIQEGLVDRPHGFSGPAALFGYRHLLQLLAIKVLQSRFLPIRKIKEEIRSLESEELESRVESWAGPPMETRHAQQIVRDPETPDAATRVELRRQDPDRDAARRYLESLPGEPVVPPRRPIALSMHEGPSTEMRTALPPRNRTVRAGWSSMATLGEPSGPRQDLYALSLPAEPRGDVPGGAVTASGWHRFELFPGIEVHVREEVELPEGPSFPSVLASRLRVILEHLRRRT